MIPAALNPIDAATTLVQAANRIAGQHQLPAALVRAIITVESGGDCWAWRHEPEYPYLWDCARKVSVTYTGGTAAPRLPPDDFHAAPGRSILTEWIGQQSSWGCMQVMGATARSYGFTDEFPALCDPEFGIAYGCAHLVRLKARYFDRFDWKGVIAAYNAGSPRFSTLSPNQLVNQAYVEKVIAAGFDPAVASQSST